MNETSQPRETAVIADPDWHDGTMADLYQAGWSIRRIAKACGRSYGYVRDNLLRQDVTLRPRGRHQRSNKRAVSEP